MKHSQDEVCTCCRGLAAKSCALVMAWGRMPAVFPQVRSSRLGKRLCTGACMGFTHFCVTQEAQVSGLRCSGAMQVNAAHSRWTVSLQQHAQALAQDYADRRTPGSAYGTGFWRVRPDTDLHQVLHGACCAAAAAACVQHCS